MKRYYLSKIKIVVEGPGTVIKHRLQELVPQIEYTGIEIQVYPQGHPQQGQPKAKALLVMVGGIDQRILQNDPEIVPMPAVALDMKVSSIHTPTKLNARAAIAALGYSDAEVSAVWSNADGLRDVLNQYGRENDESFDCNNFDLDDL